MCDYASDPTTHDLMTYVDTRILDAFAITLLRANYRNDSLDDLATRGACVDSRFTEGQILEALKRAAATRPTWFWSQRPKDTTHLSPHAV